jgi:hypothetical protein
VLLMTQRKGLILTGCGPHGFGHRAQGRR